GCQTFSGSWGYYRDEMSWKTPELCIQMLIHHVSRGGNMLMNVGPTSRGYIDSRAMNRLEAFGKWMKYHSRSIYNCTSAPEEFEEPLDCRYTYNPETNRLYLHIFSWPHKKVVIPGIGNRIRYIQLLNDGSECLFTVKDGSSGTHMFEKGAPGDADVLLPDLKPDVAVPVLEIFLKQGNERGTGRKEENQLV
ncbi:MAG: alpha-L-fucosidase, partial [Lentisphaeria bacterium]|nr:alpha-L-fucosidase [Lentisphaeria bacterium]